MLDTTQKTEKGSKGYLRLLLRKLLLKDLIDLTNPDEEYSSMVSQFLAKLAITA
jgi:hypothetical protein